MPTSPFRVNVAVLRRVHGNVQVEHREGHIEGMAGSGSRLPDDAVVAVDATLESVEGGVMVHATISAPWDGECVRCLRPAAGSLVADVRELYARDNDPEETYPLAGDQLDLEPMARDAVLLELPQAPLCKEECLGLCPTCGIDRNTGSCDCEQSERDPRWAALDALRND